jgi:hypothetical protein
MDVHEVWLSNLQQIKEYQSSTILRLKMICIIMYIYDMYNHTYIYVYRFVMDVHEIWLSNLQHLRDHQPSTIIYIYICICI